MRLAHALRLNQKNPGMGEPRIALVGAGGKTTAMFQLARELGTALVTATTHLATGQLNLADQHFFIHKPEDLSALEGELPSGVVLLSGPVVEAGRTAGLDADSLERVHSLAHSRQIPLLIEADGSRRRPFKAPAGHEPAIPPWVDTVIVVAGLSALGQPLEEDWVHRPELFAGLSGLRLGDEITPGALARVMIHAQGGLKNIPQGARRVALLNQTDTPQRQAQAYSLAQELLPHFQSVVVAALNPRAGQDASLPDKKTEDPVIAVHEQTAGVILAAGASRRLGQPKQLLLFQGEPLVRRVARTALAAGLAPVVAVSGAYAAEVQAALAGLPLRLVYNPDWEAGQSASLAAGLSALPTESGAAIFLLSDQPQVSIPLIRSLVELHAHTLAPIVAPQAGERRANPVLFDRLTFLDLMALTGDTGGRALFSRYPAAWLTWHDERLLLDVDTMEDYQRLVDEMGNEKRGT